MKRWDTKKTEELLSNRWITVRKDTVELPNGMMIDDFYTVTIPDAAAIVAITPDMEIILKREFKYSAGEELLEIPAGMFEADELGSLEVAKRELLEETGYSSDRWQYLGATIENASKLTNRMHIYLAQDCRKTAEQNLDATEEVEVVVMRFTEAVEKVLSNEIKTNCSAHGILKAAVMLNIR